MEWWLNSMENNGCFSRDQVYPVLSPPSKHTSVHPSSTHSKTPPPSQPKCCLINQESMQHGPNSEEESLSSNYGVEVDETGSQPTIEDIGSQSVEDLRSQPYLNFDADFNIEVSAGSPEVNSALPTGSQAICEPINKNQPLQPVQKEKIGQGP
ncbi:hypothetical protein SERLA73DRAFT_78688 [Serpula lacrymans var. lacrymans S7.3]|uniref:Uncharacterized protein n=1 Tax=Serpula lacrymans var. lacrymans (strain S7.3) TaxID=936435 RepID=F8QE06_SERL3|nr:hypothetical protein SERLA73DRAFT_78688 [Serpula lacrymans var. lacrymans S7.3]